MATEAGAGRTGDALLVVAAGAPPLALRLFLSYLRAKRKANRAGRSFYRAAISGGIPKQEARSLADAYSGAISLRQIIKGFGSLDSLEKALRQL